MLLSAHGLLTALGAASNSRAAFFALHVPSLQAAKPRTLADLTDNQLLHLLSSGAISPHKLEADIGDATRAVHVRRLFTAQQLAVSASASKEKAAHDPFKAMAGLPMAAFDHNTFYKSILNTNCEAVIG